LRGSVGRGASGRTAPGRRCKDRVTPPRPPIALTIAGSDSGGGAGIQADLKTFHQHRVYGTCAITLVTAQNTLGVLRVDLLPIASVVAQIDAVAEDLRPAATKTGALGSAPGVEAVAAATKRHDLRPLVVDPVMVSKHGATLLDSDGIDAVRRTLLPHATLVTPNVPEAVSLLGGGVIASERDMEAAARALVGLGATAALVKGGHGEGADVIDVLYDGQEVIRLASPRIDTRHTHGTGCSYSAAITAHLARGDPLSVAVPAAHAWLQRAIAGAPGLGAGHGPLDHWAVNRRGG
jgi:hydroxymethylpyrimidine/phosphomethylpyrimidine kinase